MQNGVVWDNSELLSWIGQHGLSDCCHLLGRRQDIARLTAAFDIAAASSWAEGFPLSIGEAMACEIPCVVTDVGDMARMVGDTGRVVAPQDPQALAAAWQEVIETGAGERRRLGLAARRRVEQHFGLPEIVKQYEELYTQLGTRQKSVPH